MKSGHYFTPGFSGRHHLVKKFDDEKFILCHDLKRQDECRIDYSGWPNCASHQYDTVKFILLHTNLLDVNIFEYHCYVL